MSQTSAELEWRDGRIPVSTQFDDPYYSLDNGLNETRHVFLNGNGLPENFRDGMVIGELGFGTGLNFLTTLLEWRNTGQTGQFHFVSFEAFPMDPSDMTRAQLQFDELAPLAQDCTDLWPALWDHGSVTLPDATLTVIVGDARDTLAHWNGAVDHWYLDGFSPAKNPELWDSDLLNAVAAKTVAGGRAATYTAAGFVRRNLESAGFSVTRTPGFGRKRHMTTAVKATSHAK